MVMLERPIDWKDVAYEHGANEVAMKLIPCSLILRVKSMWCGENGKVSVVKKGKEKGYTDDLVRNLHSYRSPATAPESLSGILNTNRKIRKRTDTNVAFTREYSRVSIFHRERECTN